MPLTINGIFENGKIVLEELPPSNERMPVKIIFPDIKNETPLKKNEVRFGSLKGKISVPDDFDNELSEIKFLSPPLQRSPLDNPSPKESELTCYSSPGWLGASLK